MGVGSFCPGALFGDKIAAGHYTVYGTAPRVEVTGVMTSSSSSSPHEKAVFVAMDILRIQKLKDLCAQRPVRENSPHTPGPSQSVLMRDELNPAKAMTRSPGRRALSPDFREPRRQGLKRSQETQRPEHLTSRWNVFRFPLWRICTKTVYSQSPER